MIKKVENARRIIRETAGRWSESQVFVAWTGGKDSTVLLHLIRSTFGGSVPFRILFNDSTIEFPEVYDFIRRIHREWKLDLVWLKHLPVDLRKYRQATNPEDQMEIMRLAKIHAINHAQKRYGIRAFLSGIRRDEHPDRSQESFFSERKTHVRVHPILEFSYDDIWTYIREFEVPYVSLYDQGYKSLGEAPFTKPVADESAPERSGREATKEEAMKRLREMGYW